MPHLLEVGLKRELTAAEARRFPFAVPAIRELPLLDVMRRFLRDPAGEIARLGPAAEDDAS
jgi:hypothetical protein